MHKIKIMAGFQCGKKLSGIEFSMHVYQWPQFEYVLIGRRCITSFTSGFVDDVTFSHSGLYSIP